jgi:hypothetical protein
MAKPSIYDELYPSRFLKASLLKGQKVTLTIKDVDLEELIGDDNKAKQKATLSFEERPMQHVMCKTNGICLKEMFGKELAKWIGKRVTLFAGNWNGEEAIRVWGSPDIAADINVEVALPRRKPFKMTMHKVGSKAVSPATSTTTDPRISAAFGILGWTPKEQADFLTENAKLAPAEMLAKLNATIDAQDAVEVQ